MEDFLIILMEANIISTANNIINKKLFVSTKLPIVKMECGIDGRINVLER